MSTTSNVQATVWEDGDAYCLARVHGTDNAAVTQASLTSVHYTVHYGATTVTASTSLTVSNVVYDTLQTDAIWTVDSTGYNFKHMIADTELSVAGVVYVVRYKFTFTDATITWAEFALSTRRTALPS